MLTADREPVADDTAERLAFVEHVLGLLLADAAWRARPKPGKRPSDRDRAALAEIAAQVNDGGQFLAGDLSSDRKQARATGRALGRLARYAEVDGWAVRRVGSLGHRAVWTVTAVRPGGSKPPGTRRGGGDPGAACGDT